MPRFIGKSWYIQMDRSLPVSLSAILPNGDGRIVVVGFFRKEA